MQEKRERGPHRKFEARWPVTIQTTAELIEAETRDISATGVSIHYKQPLKPNEIIRLFITPPDHPAIVVGGKPLWYVSYDLDENSAHGPGVCFIEVPKHDRQILSEVIWAHFKTKINRLGELE